MIKFHHQASISLKDLTNFQTFFLFIIFLFKIMKLGKHLSSTYARVDAGKEFAWFQRNEKSNYHLYPVLDH